MSSTAQRPTEAELLPLEQQQFHPEYKGYFKTKRTNFFATLQAFSGLWECFQLLDDIWMREFSDLEVLRDVNQMLPAILCMNGHIKFRVAMELGFSCCLGEAWDTLRSGIESVAHAHKIHREPSLGPVWSGKNNGPSEAEAFKNAFERNKKESLFPAQHGLDKLHIFWSSYSELGTHTTVTSIGKSFEHVATAEDINWRLHYFEKNPERLATYLFSLLFAAYYMEKACFDCFRNRLGVDPELSRMREQFEKLKDQERQNIIRRFNLTPPSIWP